FRVEGREFRHYTPSYYDGPSGICEVLFYLHGLGPGSSWAAELAPGDQMKLMGPGGRTAYQESAPFHVFFGDESALGLCLNLAREADRQGTPFQCLLELAAHHSGWPEELGLSAKVVGKSEESPASPALHWLESLPLSTWTDWQEASFYLAGRVRSIQQLRKYLKAKGIASRQLISAPYWTEGKRGL
ncbi:MAG: siderophore-interacting protein, partial [Bacteroidota bacterium]